MKTNKIFNYLTVTTALFGIFTAAFSQPALSDTTIANVCKESDDSNSDYIVSLNNDSQTIEVKTPKDSDGFSRNRVKTILKDEYDFSNEEAEQVKRDLSSYDRTTGIPVCQQTAANASPNTITLEGTLRDFEDTHPDFERTPGQDGFRYGLDTGITTADLGADSNPVYAGGSFSTTTKANFDQWYRDVSGVNQSMPYSIELTKDPDTNIYSFDNDGEQFFPLDGLLFGNDGRSHNYHFTYELHTRFTYNGGETFAFSGDDDVWVYINGKKVIDIGGVHNSINRRVDLDEVASEIGLEVGETYDLNFFFAERHTTLSNFRIETTLELETAPEPVYAD